jgi:hypothetical protein
MLKPPILSFWGGGGMKKNLLSSFKLNTCNLYHTTCNGSTYLCVCGCGVNQSLKIWMFEWVSPVSSEPDCLFMVLPWQPSIQTPGCWWQWDSQGISRQASTVHIYRLDSTVHDGRTANSKHSIMMMTMMKMKKECFTLRLSSKEKLTHYSLFLCLQDFLKKTQNNTTLRGLVQSAVPVCFSAVSCFTQFT